MSFPYVRRLHILLCLLAAQPCFAAAGGVACIKDVDPKSDGFGGVICTPRGDVSCKSMGGVTGNDAACESRKTGYFECRTDEKGMPSCYSAALHCVKKPGDAIDCAVKPAR
jgi:hypothetical protein